ncbi:MAG: HEPN domain-containing protein [Candidatus Aminicenantes bacterium]|nr:MAG: HEPN domain-containing protein [Candidatus Aminicenantes bacterium]
MIDKEKQVLLAKYRLEQAKESIDEAEYLYSGNKSPRSVMNRLYYAMFYAVLALIVFERFILSKHTGVLSFFNKQFIKENVFPTEMGRWINKAFELRQKGDYREYVELTREQVEPYIEFAKSFVKKVEEFLEEKKFSNE